MNKTALWTAIVTPMHEDGSVHYPDFEGLLRRQEAAGNGIIILGSTGEGLALNDEEKQEVVKFAASLGLKVPLFVGVGGFQLEQQLQFMAFCEQHSVDGYLLVTPLYAKPGKTGQYEWFAALMKATKKGCMIYNVPSRTGVKLHPQVPAMLSESFENVYGVKEASGSITEFQEYRIAAPMVDFFSGDDGLTPFFCAAGGIGLVSVASNVWPEATARYVELCLEQKTDSFLPVWKQATDQLFNGPNPVPVKVLLKHKGWISFDAVRPPLNSGDVGNPGALAAADESVATWVRNQQQ